MNLFHSFEFNAYGETFRVETDILLLEPILKTMFPQKQFASSETPSLKIRFNAISSESTSIASHDHAMHIDTASYELIIHGKQVVNVSRSHGIAQVNLDPAWLDKSPEMARALLLEAPVLVLLSWHRFPLIHAAGVAINGRGYLLTGQSGSGKSSLAYACTQTGFDFLAEDYLFIAERDGCYEIRGIPASLKQCRETLSFFPNLLGLPAEQQLNGEVKIETIHTIPNRQKITRAPLSRMFLLTDAEQTGPKTISAEILQKHIIESLMFDPEGMLERHRRDYGKITNKGAVQMGMCKTPQDRAEMLKQMLEAEI